MPRSYACLAVLLAGAAASAQGIAPAPNPDAAYSLRTYTPPPPPPPPSHSSFVPMFPGAPGGGGFFPGMMYPGFNRMDPYSGYLQGLASVTAATGQYQKDIQDARMTRYAANNAAIDSARKTVEWETEYERRKQRLWREEIEGEKRTRLDRARRDAPNSEIWAGSTFNVLLKSILDSSSPLSGPPIPVEPRIVHGLNFVEKGSRGNVGLAKDEGRIVWTGGLGEKAFDSVRDEFEKNFQAATSSLRAGSSPPRDTMAALRSDLKRLETTLDREFDNMSPGDYTTSKRQLRQLRDSVTGLSDPRAATAFSSAKKSLRTVSDIVGHLMKNGMEFGPVSSAGDEPAYSAFYFSLRDYERGISAMASRR